jgi:hypothetical protein
MLGNTRKSATNTRGGRGLRAISKSSFHQEASPKCSVDTSHVRFGRDPLLNRFICRATITTFLGQKVLTCARACGLLQPSPRGPNDAL